MKIDSASVSSKTHSAKVPVTAPKTGIGRAYCAASALDTACAVLAMEHGVVPPTANLHTADPECDLDYVAGGARAGVELSAAMSNSFAFGGTTFGKPHEPAIATARWRAQRGGTGVLHSGHHLIDARTGEGFGETARAAVRFAPDLDEEEITAYEIGRAHV